MAEIDSDQQSQIEDQERDALDSSRRALREVQDSARIQAQTEAVKMESFSELANFLRQERQALQASIEFVDGMQQTMIQIINETINIRNSLLEEYEIQQEITATMQQQRKPTDLREQEPTPETQQSTGRNFFLNS